MTIVWNAERVSAGLREIEIARPAVLARVKQLLDDYHGVERSLRYYDILLGDWCERFLHLVYVATQELHDGNHGNNHDWDALPTVDVVIPGDTAQYFANYPTLPTITLATIRALGATTDPSVVRISAGALSIRGTTPAGHRGRVISKMLQTISSRRPTRVVFVRPFLSRIPLMWVGVMTSWRSWARHDDMEIDFNETVLPDVEWRGRNLSALTTSSSLTEVAQGVLSVHLPAAVLEGFAEIRSRVVRARPHRPAHVYSAQALWTHLAFKILAAEWCEQGTKLHYHQHGGWHGLDELHVGERYECRVSDTYYTWGWSRGDSNSRPLSPPTPRQRARGSSYDSLICFDQPPQIYRLQYFPLPGTLQTMYAQVAEFVKLRTSSTDLKIRLFPGNYGSAHRDAILAAKPDAMFGVGGNIFSQYFASRLVVHGYLGTSWLETLGSNIATICFYSPAAYRFRLDAKPLLEDLVRVGILHTSGRSAAEHANRIDRDIESWWQSVEVQSARRAFVEKYANFSANWKSEWEQEFMRVLRS